jgi:hypothetical protein
LLRAARHPIREGRSFSLMGVGPWCPFVGLRPYRDALAFVGLTLKKARKRIVRAHCRVGKVTKKFTTRRKKGRVLSQKPKPSRLLAQLERG